MESPLRVRKGAWSEEEDNLLRQCIQKYGEGKWHQVPLRTGLNRCRKSCRLRWLNYLKPNINRGEFTVDEVDLIIRLHKLLRNRWSLIAGRLPGRTANDVKNYWNTHLHKKVVVSSKEDVKGKAQKITTTNIIKPRPWIFKKNLSWLMENPAMVNDVQFADNLCKLSTTSPPRENEAKTNIIKPRPRVFKKKLSLLMGNPTSVNNVQFGDNLCKLSTPSPLRENEGKNNKNLSLLMGNPTSVSNVQFGDSLCKLSTTSPPRENEILWWENLLSEKEVDERNTCGSEKEPIRNLWAEDNAPGTKVGDLFVEEGHGCCSDFSFDADLWNLFKSEQERVMQWPYL